MTPTAQESSNLAAERLDQVVRDLAAALSPVRIYLFGSRVYGTPRPDSDFDVMVIVDDTSRLTTDDLRRAHDSLRGLFVPVELHYRSLSTFERRAALASSLEREVASKGRVLYAA